MSRSERIRRNPLAAMTEEELQQEVERIVMLFGWSHYHTRDSRGSEADFPDLVMLRTWKEPKRMIVAELKKEGLRATEGQQKWLNDFAVLGWEVYTWWPSDLPAIVKVLR